MAGACQQPKSQTTIQDKDSCVVQNPVITVRYSADPSARVFGDTLYIYPSHDRDQAQWWDMEDYYAYSTTDLCHYKDEGLIFQANYMGKEIRLGSRLYREKRQILLLFPY